MNWQTPAALVVVVLTAALFAWRRWRRQKLRFQQASGCGCSVPGVRPPNVLVAGKRGEKPRVTVKSG